MVEVPEEELENLLDQINTLHSQVNDLLSSKKAENPPEDRIDDKSENTKPTSEVLPATHEASHSSQAQPEDIVSSPSTAGPLGLDVTTTRGENQAEQTSVEQSEGKPEEETATLTQSQSEKVANSQNTLSSDNKASQHPPQTPSTGSSQELSKETALSVPGGRFKETHTRFAIKTSTAAATASAQETFVGPEEHEPKEQTDDTSGDECPAADLVVRAEVDGTMTIMNEPLANARNTNCSLRTHSADASKHDSTSSSPLETFTPLATRKPTTSLSSPELVVTLTASSASEDPSEASSASTIPTDAVVSAEEDEPIASETPRQFRTLVFTSVLMRESTITVTSLQTEVYTVVQTGGTSTDHVSAVTTGPSATEEVVQQTETATPTSIATDLSASASNLDVASNANSTLMGGSGLQVATVQESSASVLSHSSDSATAGGTTSISHLSSFKTLLKPTTSITEA